MFERYTDGARRVIFLAREEAMQYGGPYIETEHLLLAILREDHRLCTHIAEERSSAQSIRKEIEGKTVIRLSISQPVEVPLSDDSKRVLNFAAEESSESGNKQITSGHLVLGILQLKECLAARILQAHGVTILAIREEIRRSSSASD